MYWTDGSIYKGYWLHGVENGLGLMIFPDGIKRAGLFELNTYKLNIDN
jgi:hypothetical protein